MIPIELLHRRLQKLLELLGWLVYKQRSPLWTIIYLADKSTWGPIVSYEVIRGDPIDYVCKDNPKSINLVGHASKEK